MLRSLLGFVLTFGVIRAQELEVPPATESLGSSPPPALLRDWRLLAPFSRIELCTPQQFTVLVAPTPDPLQEVGANFSVLVRGEPSVVEALRTSVALNSTLRLQTVGDFSTDRIFQVVVFLPQNNLRSLQLSNGGQVRIAPGFNISRASLSISTAGVSKVVATGLVANNLRISTAGSSLLHLNGSFAAVSASTSGITDLEVGLINGPVSLDLSGIPRLTLVGTERMNISKAEGAASTAGGASTRIYYNNGSCNFGTGVNPAIRLPPSVAATLNPCKKNPNLRQLPDIPLLNYACGLQVAGNFSCGAGEPGTSRATSTTDTSGSTSSSSASSTSGTGTSLTRTSSGPSGSTTSSSFTSGNASTGGSATVSGPQGTTSSSSAIPGPGEAGAPITPTPTPVTLPSPTPQSDLIAQALAQARGETGNTNLPGAGGLSETATPPPPPPLPSQLPASGLSSSTQQVQPGTFSDVLSDPSGNPSGTSLTSLGPGSAAVDTQASGTNFVSSSGLAVSTGGPGGTSSSVSCVNGVCTPVRETTTVTPAQPASQTEAPVAEPPTAAPQVLPAELVGLEAEAPSLAPLSEASLEDLGILGVLEEAGQCTDPIEEINVESWASPARLEAIGGALALELLDAALAPAPEGEALG